MMSWGQLIFVTTDADGPRVSAGAQVTTVCVSPGMTGFWFILFYIEI